MALWRRAVWCRRRPMCCAFPMRRSSSGSRRRWSTSTPPRWWSNRNPLLDDPFFRRFFGSPEFGVPREQVQRSLGSGVIVDASRPRSSPTTTSSRGPTRSRSRSPTSANSRPRSCSRTPAPILPSCGSRHGRERFPALELGNSDAASGRRPGAGDRQSVRRRPDRDPRHRLGGGAHAGRHFRLPVLHPDRRRHQSRQFRRSAGRHGRQARRHQHRDLLALRRLAGHRLCHSRPTWCGWWSPRRAMAAARSSGRGSAPICRR